MLLPIVLVLLDVDLRDAYHIPNNSEYILSLNCIRLNIMHHHVLRDIINIKNEQ